jgi:cell division septum initiation protein DivIVA
MPDESTASTEHAILQEITAPLATLPHDPVPAVADVDFPIALRGYDRLAVDAYVKRTSQLVAELQATRSPEAAVRRALERVGEEVSGILQRAHETGSQITAQSRIDAENRLDAARQEAADITAGAERRLKELDTETDRIWAERHRIVEDAQDLAGQLLALASSATERFPAEDIEPPEGALEPLADELEPAADDFESPVDGPVGAEPLGEHAGADGEGEHLFDGEADDRLEDDAPEAAHEQHDHEAHDPEHDPEATAVMPPITPREDQPS